MRTDHPTFKVIAAVVAVVAGIATIWATWGPKDPVARISPPSPSAPTQYQSQSSSPTGQSTSEVPSRQTPSPTIQHQGILITAFILPDYSIGKDKGQACPNSTSAFPCASIQTNVTDGEGDVGEDCNMSYKLYRNGSLANQGRPSGCNDSIWIGGHGRPTPAGSYRLRILVEFDDGTKASHDYNFRLV